jgi:hypothetical protein
MEKAPGAIRGPFLSCSWRRLGGGGPGDRDRSLGKDQETDLPVTGVSPDYAIWGPGVYDEVALEESQMSLGGLALVEEGDFHSLIHR